MAVLRFDEFPLSQQASACRFFIARLAGTVRRCPTTRLGR